MPLVPLAVEPAPDWPDWLLMSLLLEPLELVPLCELLGELVLDCGSVLEPELED